MRPHGVFGGARLGWAGQTDLGADREATHCQGAGWGSKDWDVGGAARALEGTRGLPTREVGAPGGADSAAGMAHVRKWCSCSGRGRGSARSLKGGGHWRISAKVGCQRGLRNGGRTSTQSCPVGWGRGCRGARAGSVGAMRGLEQGSGLAWVTCHCCPSAQTAGQGQRVEAAAGALAGAGRPSGARVWLRQVVTRHGPHQGAN